MKKMQTFAKNDRVITEDHVKNWDNIQQLRNENRDLIDYACRFYCDSYQTLIQCIHCVSDQYTTTESNKAKILSLIAEERQALEGIEKIFA